MAGSAPNYDNVMWPGAGGLRVPTEVIGTKTGGPSATLDIDLLVVTAAQAGSSVTLSSAQVDASALVVGSMSSTTNNVVLYPAAFPGNIVALKNSSGSSCTFKVTGGTGFALANGSHCIAVLNATDVEQWTAAF